MNLKTKNLKEQLIKTYKEEPNLKDTIIGLGIVLILGIISFVSGRYTDLFLDKVSYKLTAYPVEICLFSETENYTECFLKPCEGFYEDCNKKYKKRAFLKKIEKDTFVIVDNSKIYLDNNFYNKYFCERSGRCVFKRGKYHDNNSIQEFETDQIWKREEIKETDIIQFRHKKKSSFMNTTLKDFNIVLENICKDYKKVSE